MYLGYAIVGFVIGGMVAGGGPYFPLGAIFGAVTGLLLARLIKLDRRVKHLESLAHASQQISSSTNTSAAPPAGFAAEIPRPPSVESLNKDRLWPARDDEPEPLEKRALADAQSTARPAAARPHPSILQQLVKRASDWLTSGNIPVKVGVIISFIGMAFLLKYAIDRKLFFMPLELRLLAVAAVGFMLLAIGWRLRTKARVYALSLQGGGAGILFMTIFAALRLWQMLPASTAFVLLIVLSVSFGALAVVQNSRSLVILGVVGGFLAPVLTSTGNGSHVVLFSYYLVLNGAILGIAWYRAWRELNLVGFVFTFLIGSWWGYQYYQPEWLTSTMPFLVLHFLLYQLIAILFALRQAPERIGLVDGTLVFGTPVICFALQAALVRDTEYGLAISATVVAVFYALTAIWLWRRKTVDLGLLTESFMALAVAFATMAIPLAFDARWTAAAWAPEGAALVWVGARQNRQLAKLAGAALIIFSGFAFIDYGWRHHAGLPVLNGNLLGGLLISLSAFFAARKLETGPQKAFKNAHQLISLALFVWALLWWVGSGWEETHDRVAADNRLAVFLLFLAASTAAANWLSHALPWVRLRQTLAMYLPMMALLVIAYEFDQRHFLLGLGWLAWPAAWLSQVFVLRAMDKNKDLLAASAHVLSLLLLTLMLALETWWWIERATTEEWAGALVSAVPGLMALLVWGCGKKPAWPVPAHPMSYLAASMVLIAGQVTYLLQLSVIKPGGPESGPYIPVLNPFDLALLFAIATALLSLAVIQRKSADIKAVGSGSFITPYKLALLAAFFILSTMALVRGVHQFTSVPWNLNALFKSVVVQTALSIYWGVLGFSGMIWGARRKLRLLWLAGAAFMALVVLKLFLIDLGNSGTVERIISFIGIGALLLVVGYFAPAPPRQPETS